MVAPVRPKPTRTRPKAGRLVAEAAPPDADADRRALARELLGQVAAAGGRLSLRVRFERGHESWRDQGPRWALVAAADLEEAGLATLDGSGDVLDLTDKGRVVLDAA